MILRFDPDDQPIVSVAVRARTIRAACASSRPWPTRCHQAAGERARRRPRHASSAASSARSTSSSTRPHGSAGRQRQPGLDAVRNENQELPAGSVQRGNETAWSQINARMERARRLRRHHRGPARRPRRSTCAQVANVVDGPQECDSLALYNGERTVPSTCQVAGREHHRGGATACAQAARRAAEGACRRTSSSSIVRDSSRASGSVDNVQRTMIEGAPAHHRYRLPVPAFLAHTVITGLTLPIALFGTFMFMSLRLHDQHASR